VGYPSDPIPCDIVCQLGGSYSGLMYVALGCVAALLIEAIALALLLGKRRDRNFILAPLAVSGLSLLLAAVCWLAYRSGWDATSFLPPLPARGNGETRGLDIWGAFVVLATGLCLLGGVLRLFGFDGVQWVRDGLHGEEPPRWR